MPETQLDKDRRREIARQALDTAMRDPLWLHNLSQCLHFQNDAYDDLLDTAEALRQEADLIEEAHRRIEDGELIPAEAALYIAENAPFHSEYGTREHIYDTLPIQAREAPSTGGEDE
jgi:dsDNA-binding SOS-regulon protein